LGSCDSDTRPGGERKGNKSCGGKKIASGGGRGGIEALSEKLKTSIKKQNKKRVVGTGGEGDSRSIIPMKKKKAA